MTFGKKIKESMERRDKERDISMAFSKRSRETTKTFLRNVEINEFKKHTKGIGMKL